KSETFIEPPSELSVIDISDYYNNIELLPDLILTRQFELIPASIGILSRLRLKIAELRSEASGKHEKLLKLQCKVVEISVNALDGLFASTKFKNQQEDGDREETPQTQELLFNYVRGKFRDDEKQTGPKFPCRNENENSQIDWYTILEMIEEADCNELFATDCIYSLTQKDWKTGRRPCKCGSTADYSDSSLQPKTNEQNHSNPCATGLLIIRSMRFLILSDLIGPVATMLWKLIFNDLIPFLAIVGVIIAAFGVFFFNLLFTVTGADPVYRNSTWYRWHTFVQGITLPFNILFTNFDKMEFKSEITNQNVTIGKQAHSEGLGFFENLMLFIFMGLVNIVMLNLLIALFSLRVNRMANEAVGIWRKEYYYLVREYENISPVPPPFSFIYYIYNFIRNFCNCCHNSVAPGPDDTNQLWWNDQKKYPEDYMAFLKFQAEQFRELRPRLLSKSQDDFARQTEQRFEALEIQTQEMLAILQRLEASGSGVKLKS
uniref:Ion_trans domain-containing protein n=1 Tax=Macrostomum lignano TaxID=282301 RepID=A0A1I8G751_9PLAT